MTSKSGVLIIGCARSGTTLLSELLSQHDHVFISPETKFFQYIYSQRFIIKLLPKGQKDNLIFKSLINSEYSTREEPIFPKYSDELKSKIQMFSNDLPRLFVEILETLGGEAQIIGEKTPWHSFFEDKLPDNFKILAITREALPNIASLYRRKGFRNVSSIESCLARWIHINNHILTLITAPSKSRIHHVKFESLVSDTRNTIGQICEFLDLDFDEKMIVPIGQDSSSKRNNDSHSNQEIDQKVNQRFEEKLSRTEIEFIKGMSQSVQQLLGYKYCDRTSSGVESSLKLKYELIKLKVGVSAMRSGFYPFGALRFIAK